jgi:uncharacterized membrane protein (DUF485 family)
MIAQTKEVLKQWAREKWPMSVYLLLYLIFAVIITYAWMGIEVLEEGEITSSVADSIFALMLVFSLLINIAMFRFIKYKHL